MFEKLANFFREIKDKVREIKDKVKEKIEDNLWHEFLKLSPQKKSEFIKDIMNKDKKINRIAEILELELKKGSVKIKATLKGETEPMEISLEYTLKEDSICIKKVDINKEWLQALADVFREKYSEIKTSVFGQNEDKAKEFINSLF